MKQGKVSMAIRALAPDEAAGILPLDDTTRKALRDKHPPAREAAPDTMYGGTYIPPPAAIFDRITGEDIRKHALHTNGAAGPSGMDTKAWRNIPSHARYGSVANDLCNTIAAMARKMATETCQDTEAFTACRLIALDKKPGCRPIGVGEVLRRIVGKAIMEVTKDDIKAAVGNLQVCAGQKAGGEAAVHAMRTIYNDPDSDAVLHTGNSDTIESAEGTTQGDPVAMAMYAIGLLRLQDHISHEKTQVKQVAYADDLAGAGKINDLRKWWDLIQRHGPPKGYHPNAQKSILIVKPGNIEKTKECFGNLEIQINADGEKYLGAVLGTEQTKETFEKSRVEGWIGEMKRLANIAKEEPHAAYTAFTFGLKHKWKYLMRAVPNIRHLLQPIEDTIKRDFIPALSGGRNSTDLERAILELPPRMGGMGITNPCKISDTEHRNSVRLTGHLTQHIVSQIRQGEINEAEQKKMILEITKTREENQKAELENLLSQLSEDQQRRMQMAQEVGASNWLTALPIKAKGFSLNKQEFVDALALRYGWHMDGLPQSCSCGSPFNTNHAMTCKTGGFVVIRHDEVRDLTAQMLREVCHDVRVEPDLLPTGRRSFTLRSVNTAEDARLNISARGFWARGQRAFFDVRIFNPMAQSNRDQDLHAAHGKRQDPRIWRTNRRSGTRDFHAPCIHDHRRNGTKDCSDKPPWYATALSRLILEQFGTRERCTARAINYAWLRVGVTYAWLSAAHLSEA
ncbi:uncharacterized protein LOC125042504 [Penaeus chinensis]|uniref:uncharacterized protein LOC125042504 n=1 Tax=Penaeus chinensis TaxID=139456 RepID=UPI001FB74C9A|nr:uncharacterized protein LOC125042504 [Penaeus chinensis]